MIGERVELVPAWLWTCDNCGRDNFERSVVAELSAEEMDELKQEHGVEEFHEGDFLSAPEQVCCKGCGEEFQTKEFRED